MSMAAQEITRFQGEYRFLSNFFPCVIHLAGEKYASVEHAYQAAKARTKKHRQWVGAAATPQEAKMRGRQIPLRADWEGSKITVMHYLLQKKFARGGLKQMLLDTGNAYLEEANTWGDNFWGTVRGRGHNHLGKLLMRVREELRR
jgi:ribA/ribD-fused uncharacterized protein